MTICGLSSAFLFPVSACGGDIGDAAALVLISIDEVPEAMFELGRAEVLAAAAVDVLAAQGIRAVPYEDDHHPCRFPH